MTIVLDGSKGISIPDGSVTEPSIRGFNGNTGIFYTNNDITFTAGGVSRFIVAANGAIIANGSITSAGGAEIQFNAGSVTSPSITTVGDTNTGMFFPAADTIAFTEGGTEVMRISNTGRVGIGTTTILARFDLAGDYRENWITANTGSSYTIDISNGTFQTLSLTNNCSFTFPAGTIAGRSFTLLLSQDSTGGRTVTWPAAVYWPNNTAPTITSTASRTDKFVFSQDGLGRWLGSVAGQNYTI